MSCAHTARAAQMLILVHMKANKRRANFSSSDIRVLCFEFIPIHLVRPGMPCGHEVQPCKPGSYQSWPYRYAYCTASACHFYMDLSALRLNAGSNAWHTQIHLSLIGLVPHNMTMSEIF